MWRAGSGVCTASLQMNVVSRAGAGTSGILPMTALIGRWQKLFGEYGTKWPLLVLEPGAAEGPQPWSDVFMGTPAPDKSDFLLKQLLLSYRISSILCLITKADGSQRRFSVNIKSVFCSLSVVVGSWLMLSQCRKNGGVLWFTGQEDRCQTLLLISFKRKQDCLKSFLTVFKSVILT